MSRIKIKNPFTAMDGSEDYNCFGCSPANKIGLHLEFWLEGEELTAEWQPLKAYEGWTGVLHGGIQATLMDEAAAWLVMVTRNTASVTVSMNISYNKPVYIADKPVKIRARHNSVEKRLALIDCCLMNDKDEICSTAIVTCYCFPEQIARAKYKFPGSEMFFTR